MSPQTGRNLLIAMVLGAGLALAIVLLIEYLDDTVKSREQVIDLLQISPLAAIGRIDGRQPSATLITMSDPSSSAAEEYRLLRVNLEMAAADRQVRTLVVTSAMPSEGKSTTVANLAIALAQSGKRIILVDADLRRPALHQFFQCRNSRGLSTMLLGRNGRSVIEYLQPTQVPNLVLLTSGPTPPNPADALSSQRMADLVEELKAHADMVLFDSPPLLPVVDATLLVRSCDATLMVVLSARSRVGLLKRAREQLAQSGSFLIGAVLNRVAPGRSAYGERYYYYRYQNGYRAPATNGHKNGHRAHPPKNGTRLPAPPAEAPAQGDLVENGAARTRSQQE